MEASQLDTSLYKSQTKINATAITRSQTHTYIQTHYRCKQCYIHMYITTHKAAAAKVELITLKKQQHDNKNDTKK